MRSGIKLLADTAGDGPELQRQHTYWVRVKLWLNKGDPIRWPVAQGTVGIARLEDDGATLFTDFRFHRGNLINGIFYGIEGMRVGGTRKLRISPHLAYGETGVPNIVPGNAVLIAEIHVFEERNAA